MNIIVISGSSQSRLVETAKKRKHNIEVFKPADFNIYISDNTKGFDALFYNENEKLAAYKWDCAISRIGVNRSYGAAVLQHLQENMSVWCLQSGAAINTCSNKIKTAQRLSAKKLQVPKQWFCIAPKNIAFLIEKLGNLPVILKEITGSKGANIILLESAMQTNMTLESFYHKGTKFILQEFLDNGGKDERHIVVGDKVVCSMERQAPKHDIRANISLEGTARKIKASKETEQLCVDAVKAIPNLNFAGVDVIVHNGKSYLIEINSNPGERIISVTGHNYYEDILDFCEDQHRKKQNAKNEDAAQKVIPTAGGGGDPDDDDEEFCKTHNAAEVAEYFRNKNK